MKTSKLSIGLAGILALSLFGCCHDVDECEVGTYGLNCEGDVLYACVPQGEGEPGRVSTEEGICREGVPVLDEGSVLYPGNNPGVIEEKCDESAAKFSCGKDGSVLICNNGKYDAIDGHVFCNGNEIVSCNGTELSVGKYTCQDVDVNYCENDKLYSVSLLCDGDKFVSCQMKGGFPTPVASDCANGKVCRSFDRNGSTNFACVEVSNESSCGDITNAGVCNENVLTFCSNKTDGKLLKLDCSAFSKSCEKVNDTYGFDCVEKCGDNQQYTDFGSCDGNVLNYCSKGEVVTTNCSEYNLTCQFGSGDKNFYDCF